MKILYVEDHGSHLHVRTERLTFVLADTDEPRSLIQNMPLTMLKVRDWVLENDGTENPVKA